MKKQWLKAYNLLLGSMVASLGFEACDNTETAVEYGMPYAEYQIIGTVTDEDGQPVEGIKGRLGVEATDSDGTTSLHFEMGDSALTDSEGRFVMDGLSSMTHMMPSGKTVVELKDEDGEANGGHFGTEQIRLDDMEKTQVQKGSKWYEGKFELRFVRKLKRQ